MKIENITRYEVREVRYIQYIVDMARDLHHKSIVWKELFQCFEWTNVAYRHSQRTGQDFAIEWKFQWIFLYKISYINLLSAETEFETYNSLKN